MMPARSAARTTSSRPMPFEGEAHDGRGIAAEIAERHAGDGPKPGAQPAGRAPAARLDLVQPTAKA